MDLAPPANHATTFRLALLAMLLSVWLIGRVSDSDPQRPQGEKDGEAVLQPVLAPQPVEPAAKDAPAPLPPVATGHLHGVVRFVGEQPQAAIIDTGSDPYCAELYRDDEPLRSEQWLFGIDGALANVLVYVSGGLAPDAPAPPVQTAPPAAVLVRGCRITPHVTAVRLGQVLEFHNLDNTLHSLQVKPAQLPPSRHAIRAPGVSAVWQPMHAEVGIAVDCDAHPWMRAYVHVLPHPYFAVTGATGSFDIRGLPPGDYELSLWHEAKSLAAGLKPVRFRIEPGRTTQLELTVGQEP